MYQREFDLYLDRARRFFKRLENRFFLEDRELHAEIRTSADPIPIAERKTVRSVRSARGKSGADRGRAPGSG